MGRQLEWNLSGDATPSAELWLVISLQVAHADARWTDLIPGSLFYAIGIVGVQVFNVLILGQMIQSKSTTYGALGVAAALLLGFFLMGRVIVLAAVLNATLYNRHLRSPNRHATQTPRAERQLHKHA